MVLGEGDFLEDYAEEFVIEVDLDLILQGALEVLQVVEVVDLLPQGDEGAESGAVISSKVLV